MLRGRGLTLEQSLDALASAAKERLPEHLLQLRPDQRQHNFVAVAFVRGESRVYSIDIAANPSQSPSFRYTRWVGPNGRSVRIAVAGSGIEAVNRQGRHWKNALWQLIKHHERGRISAQTVADRLARANLKISEKTSDGTGPPLHRRVDIQTRWAIQGGRGPRGIHERPTRPQHPATRDRRRGNRCMGARRGNAGTGAGGDP